GWLPLLDTVTVRPPSRSFTDVPSVQTRALPSRENEGVGPPPGARGGGVLLMRAMYTWPPASNATTWQAPSMVGLPAGAPMPRETRKVLWLRRSRTNTSLVLSPS